MLMIWSFGCNFDNVEMFVEELDRELCSVGMMMNVKKTKMMVLNGEVKEPITLRGEKIDVEDSFPYLGVTIKTQQSSSGEEVAARIAKAIRVFKSLYHPYGRESKCQ